MNEYRVSPRACPPQTNRRNLKIYFPFNDLLASVRIYKNICTHFILLKKKSPIKLDILFNMSLRAFIAINKIFYASDLWPVVL